MPVPPPTFYCILEPSPLPSPQDVSAEATQSAHRLLIERQDGLLRSPAPTMRICCVDFTFDESDEGDLYHVDGDDDSLIMPLTKKRRRRRRRMTMIKTMIGSSSYLVEPQDSCPNEMNKSWVLKIPSRLRRITISLPSCIHSQAFKPTTVKLYAGTSRSLFVFTDGACSGNGTPDARGGIGVFFAPGSKFNCSKSFTEEGTHTNQKAELAAVAKGFEIVRTQFLSERRDMAKKLSMVGVQVAYYLVSREENQEAGSFAKAGIA
ncbi:hypothetical protein B0J14DRAFT_698203 [Halenospora varia]|nr:hypothetical protein B0J14DRAFT_698203 [Halenospora varia]